MKKKNGRELDLAGLTDDNGRPESLGAFDVLLQPPAVDLINAAEAASEGLSGSQLLFAVPQAGRTGWYFEPTVSALIEGGWKPVKAAQSKRGLLSEFRALAGQNIDQDAAVLEFARRWGPLWVCCQQDHVDCFWSWAGSRQGLRGRYGDPPCRWMTAERVADFVLRARQVDALLEAAIQLRQQPPSIVTADLWGRILLHSDAEPEARAIEYARQDYTFQKDRIAYCLSMMLNTYGAPSIWVEWEDDDPLDLFISSGFGFLRSAWLQLAQLLANKMGGMYTCYACQRLHPRKRRPKAGQKSFCPECGPAAARKVWDIENRSSTGNQYKTSPAFDIAKGKTKRTPRGHSRGTSKK
ncbi:MAG TPA: hypothetical protein VGO93_28635 [Candidatus Xenobia bacterium]|jgi:hypothetical protein